MRHGIPLWKSTLLSSILYNRGQKEGWSLEYTHLSTMLLIEPCLDTCGLGNCSTASEVIYLTGRILINKQALLIWNISVPNMQYMIDYTSVAESTSYWATDPLVSTRGIITAKTPVWTNYLLMIEVTDFHTKVIHHRQTCICANKRVCVCVNIAVQLHKRVTLTPGLSISCQALFKISDLASPTSNCHPQWGKKLFSQPPIVQVLSLKMTTEV